MNQSTPSRFPGTLVDDAPEIAPLPPITPPKAATRFPGTLVDAPAPTLTSRQPQPSLSRFPGKLVDDAPAPVTDRVTATAKAAIDGIASIPGAVADAAGAGRAATKPAPVSPEEARNWIMLQEAQRRQVKPKRAATLSEQLEADPAAATGEYADYLREIPPDTRRSLEKRPDSAQRVARAQQQLAYQPKVKPAKAGADGQTDPAAMDRYDQAQEIEAQRRDAIKTGDIELAETLQGWLKAMEDEDAGALVTADRRPPAQILDAMRKSAFDRRRQQAMKDLTALETPDGKRMAIAEVDGMLSSLPEQVRDLARRSILQANDPATTDELRANAMMKARFILQYPAEAARISDTSSTPMGVNVSPDALLDRHLEAKGFIRPQSAAEQKRQKSATTDGNSWRRSTEAGILQWLETNEDPRENNPNAGQVRAWLNAGDEESLRKARGVVASDRPDLFDSPDRRPVDRTAEAPAAENLDSERVLNAYREFIRSNNEDLYRGQGMTIRQRMQADIDAGRFVPPETPEAAQQRQDEATRKMRLQDPQYVESLFNPPIANPAIDPASLKPHERRLVSDAENLRASLAANRGKVDETMLQLVYDMAERDADALLMGGRAGFADTVIEYLSDSSRMVETMPIVGAGASVRRLFEAKNAWDRITAGNGEMADLMAIRAHLVAENLRGRDRDVFGKAVDIAAQSFPFAVEFGLSGGVATGLKEGTKASLKNLVTNAIKQGLKKAPTAPLKGPLLLRTVAGVTRNTMAKEMGGKDQDLGQAIRDAYADVAIEVVSEGLGTTIFGPALSKVAAGLNTDEMVNAVAKRWISKGSGRTLAAFNKAVKAGGVDDVISEILEEESGKLMRLAAGTEDYKLTTPEEFAAQALAFGAPNVGRVGAAAIDAGREARRDKARDRSLTEQLAALQKVPGNEGLTTQQLELADRAGVAVPGADGLEADDAMKSQWARFLELERDAEIQKLTAAGSRNAAAGLIRDRMEAGGQTDPAAAAASQSSAAAPTLSRHQADGLAQFQEDARKDLGDDSIEMEATAPQTRGDKSSSALAEQVGVDIVFVRSKDGNPLKRPGYYRKPQQAGERGVIYVESGTVEASREDADLVTVGLALHEVVHDLERRDPSAFQGLVNQLRREAPRALRLARDKYFGEDAPASAEQETSESVASLAQEVIGAILNRRLTTEQLERMAKAKPGLWQRILRAIDRLLAKLGISGFQARSDKRDQAWREDPQGDQGTVGAEMQRQGYAAVLALREQIAGAIAGKSAKQAMDQWSAGGAAQAPAAGTAAPKPSASPTIFDTPASSADEQQDDSLADPLDPFDPASASAPARKAASTRKFTKEQNEEALLEAIKGYPTPLDIIADTIETYRATGFEDAQDAEVPGQFVFDPDEWKDIAKTRPGLRLNLQKQGFYANEDQASALREVVGDRDYTKALNYIVSGESRESRVRWITETILASPDAFDPETVVRAYVQDKWSGLSEEQRRQGFQEVNPQSLPTGWTVTIAGEEFTVEEMEDGEKFLQDGIDIRGTRVPVDKGSVEPPDADLDAGEPAPFARRPAPVGTPLFDDQATPRTSAGSATGAGASRFKSPEPIVFARPITGPSGAEVISYEWAWRPQEFVDDKGDEKVRRISDWEQAETSARTGRDLVHKFVVRTGGKDQTVSLESAIRELGFSTPEQTKPLRSLAAALKRVAEMKLKLQSIEQQAAALSEAEASLSAQQRPAIDRDGNKWRMGDAVVWDNSGSAEIPDERRRTLEDGWRRRRLGEQGFMVDANELARQAQDTRASIAKAERRIDEVMGNAERPAAMFARRSVAGQTSFAGIDDAVDKPHEFSSSQVSLPAAMERRILDLAAQVPDDVLAGNGRESDPHITVKYGLHTDNSAELREVVRGQGPVRFMLGDITVFPAREASAQRGGEQYDVVKVDVISSGDRGLRGLNKRISEALKHTDSHPTYQPHITIAYVKPGQGERIAKSLPPVKGMTGQAESITFSSKTNELTQIPLRDGAQLERFKVTEQDLRRASAYSEGAPSIPFAWGVRQFMVDKAARLRDVAGVTREEAIEAQRGFNAAKAGASSSVREDREASAQREREPDAGQPALFARRRFTSDAIPGALVLGELNADSYTDELWKALANDGRLPQPDIHTGHRTAIGKIADGYRAASGRGRAPALGADYPSVVRRRERGAHQAIARAAARLHQLSPGWNETRISRELVQLLTGNLINADRELMGYIGALRNRIPVVPAQRWTAGMKQMPDNTQEALVYSSEPTDAVYKLIKTNEDGTVRGAVRLDDIARSSDGRPWLRGSVHRDETPLLEVLRRIDRTNEHGGFVFTELAAITTDGQIIVKQPLIDGNMADDPAVRGAALEKVGLRPIGIASASAVAELPGGRVLGAIDLHSNNLRIIDGTAFVFDAANDVLTSEQAEKLRELLPKEPAQFARRRNPTGAPLFTNREFFSNPQAIDPLFPARPMAADPMPPAAPLESEETAIGEAEQQFVEPLFAQQPTTVQQDDPAPGDAAAGEDVDETVAPARPRAAAGGRIEDFGERIIGARKDYAQLLREASDIDVAAVPLSQSWPEPDYQKLLDGGADPWIVAYIHAARDEVPTKPIKSWKLQRWVDAVTTMRGFASSLLDGRITKERLLRSTTESQHAHLLRNVADRADLYVAVGHEKSLKGVRISEGRYSVYNGQTFDKPKTLFTVEREAKATAYSNWPHQLASGDTRDEAIANFKAAYALINTQPAAAKQVSFSVYSYRTGSKAGRIYVGKKVGKEYLDLQSFATTREARDYLAQHRDDLEKQLERLKQIPEERKESNAPRVGIDHRGGQDVTPDMFQEAFGFRGVQFGNYVENDRRQQDLNTAYDALMDLAGVLGVPSRALSLNGELGLAFGARGRGGKRAPSAHYEPVQVVINLTKERGAGSLAHEWWHGLDNYFARMQGLENAYLSEGGARGGVGVRPQMLEAFEHVRQSIARSTIPARSQELDRRRSSPYWSKGREMSARAFESYIVAKLQDQGASNDYLANIVSEDYWNAEAALGLNEGQEGAASYPYPTASESPAIRAAFDHFFQTVETKSETDAQGMERVAMFARRRDPQTETPEFKAWFGDSKVVDQEGQPLVVYHGTLHDIDAFRVAGMRTQGDVPLYNTEPGIFFAARPEVAAQYARPEAGSFTGANIVPVYLSLQNPLDIDWREWAKASSDDAYNRHHMARAFAEGRRRGHDGLIIRNIRDRGGVDTAYVAFSPNQIKSATGNNGAFDAENADIRFARRRFDNQLPLGIGNTAAELTPANWLATHRRLESLGWEPIDLWEEDGSRHGRIEAGAREEQILDELDTLPFVRAAMRMGKGKILVVFAPAPSEAAASDAQAADASTPQTTGAGSVYKPRNLQSSLLADDFAYSIVNDVPLRDGERLIHSEFYERVIHRRHPLYRMSVVERDNGDRYVKVEGASDIDGGFGGATTRFSEIDSDALDRLEPVARRARAVWEETRRAALPRDEQLGMFARRSTLRPGDLLRADRLHAQMPKGTPSDPVWNLLKPMASGGPAQFAATEPETDAGRPLVNRFRKDKQSESTGVRHINEFLAQQLDVQIREGNSGRAGTTGKNPVAFIPGADLIRTRSGSWQLVLHDLGHMVGNLLDAADPGFLRQHGAALVAIGLAPGSFASTTRDTINFAPWDPAGIQATPGEGFAEWVRRFIFDPKSLDSATLPNHVTPIIVAALQQHAPAALAALRDAHRMAAAWASRSVQSQLKSFTAAEAELRPDLRQTVTGLGRMFDRLMFAVNAEHALGSRVVRPMMRGLKKVSNGLMNAAAAKLRGTEADVEAIAQQEYHVPGEVHRLLFGPASHDKGKKGLRVRDPGRDAMGRMLSDLAKRDPLAYHRFMRRFELAKITRSGTGAGHWMHLSDYDAQDIVRAITDNGKAQGRWSQFEYYVQYREAVNRGRDRWDVLDGNGKWVSTHFTEADAKTALKSLPPVTQPTLPGVPAAPAKTGSIQERPGMPYPGLTEGVDLSTLMQEVAAVEKANPDFLVEANRLNKLMDQRVLAAVVMGQFTPEEAMTIVDSRESYAPLLRQFNPNNTDRDDRSLAASLVGATKLPGAEPESGVRRAYGSALPFLPLLEAIEVNLTELFKGYARQRTIGAVKAAVDTVTAMLDVPDELVREMKRMLVPVPMAMKPAATLNDQEKRAYRDAAAAAINERTAAAKGVAVNQLPVADVVSGDDLNMDFGDGVVWRTQKPRGISLVALWDGPGTGTRTLYEVQDALLFDYFARVQQPNKALNWWATAWRGVNNASRRGILKTVEFVVRNLWRDARTALLLGPRDAGLKTMIPGYFMGKGLIDSLLPGRQRSAKMDIQDTELWGKALEAVNHPEQQARADTVWGGFLATAKEGILIPSWGTMGWGTRIAHMPGQLASTLLKPLDLVAYATGLNALSDWAERLSRRGAYLSVIDSGGSPEIAQLAYDKVSGNFIARGGTAAGNALISTSLFANATLQTTYQLYESFADPSKRAGSAMRLAIAAGGGVVLALIIRAMMDDDDVEDLRKQTEAERLKNMHIPIPGTDIRLRAPFSYGAEGAAESWGYNLTMNWLLDQKTNWKAQAADTFKRVSVVDSLIGFLSPGGKLLVEYWANNAIYDGREIIPGYLRDELPEMQYSDRTSEFAKWYGRATGNSPVWAEHVANSLLGRNLLAVTRLIESGGATVQELSDIPGVGGLFAREARGFNSRPVQEVFERADRFEQARSVVTRLTDEGLADDPRVARETAVMQEHGNAYAGALAIRKINRAIRAARASNAADRETIAQLERAMTEVARQVLPAEE